MICLLLLRPYIFQHVLRGEDGDFAPVKPEKEETEVLVLDESEPFSPPVKTEDILSLASSLKQTTERGVDSEEFRAKLADAIQELDDFAHLRKLLDEIMHQKLLLKLIQAKIENDRFIDDALVSILLLGDDDN